MDLEKLFNPSSIALIGVSANHQKVGHLVAKNIIDGGYKGELYLVNPKGEKVLGRKTYKTVSEIGKPIDLAILAVPAEVSLILLDELHKEGIKNIVLYAAGFKETDAQGEKREELLKDIARQYQMNIIGPNCIGFINTHNSINATFLKHNSPKGNIGFISQSGALGSVLVDYFAAHHNLGFSYFMSIGNKTILDEVDMLRFLENDSQTEVIALYLEDVKDGARFTKALQEITLKKPVIILKSGTTKEGVKAAISHTGGLVGDDDVYSAVFRQTGAIRADSFDELMILLKLYSYHQIPHNKSLLVLSNAGGAGVLLTDALIHNHLELLTISHQTKHNLKEMYKESKKISIHNPIDLLGDASAFDYKQVIAQTLEEKKIGGVIILLTPQANTQIMETAKVIAQVHQHSEVPLYPIFMGEKSVQAVEPFFEQKQIASFSSIALLPQALHKVIANQSISAHQYFSFEHLAIKAAEPAIAKLLKKQPAESIMNVYDSLSLLKAIDIAIPKQRIIESAKDVKSAFEKMKLPFFAKIISSTITHKTEVNGVRQITTKKDLETALQDFTKLSAQCLVQETIKGPELFLGAKRDPHFGVIIVLGLGGIYTELLKETVEFVMPFSFEEFKNTLSHTKINMLLKGYRSLDPIQEIDLFRISSKVGLLLQHFSSISEIDINPLIIHNNTLVAVDSRIICT